MRLRTPPSWPTETRVFLAVGAFFVVIGVLYWATADEPAGVVLRLGAAILAATYAIYFARHLPAVQESVEAQEEGERPNELYLPEQSLWPLGIGAAVVLILAGFAIGTWVWFFGGLLLVRSVVGFVIESRNRE